MAIMTGMSANVGKMQKQMSYWEKFKHIWDYDKEGFIRRYAKNPRGVDDFEKDITRSACQGCVQHGLGARERGQDWPAIDPVPSWVLPTWVPGRYRQHQKEVFQEESMSTLGFICIDCQVSISLPGMSEMH
eukprot:2933360-Rhodomonas_salina.1